MKTIYKYPISVGDDIIVEMPAGAVPLSAEMQGEVMFVWAQVDTERDIHNYQFHVRGTGHTITGFVWHVFYNPMGIT